jgi:hypothetical protein
VLTECTHCAYTYSHPLCMCACGTSMCIDHIVKDVDCACPKRSSACTLIQIFISKRLYFIVLIENDRNLNKIYSKNDHCECIINVYDDTEHA